MLNFLVTRIAAINLFQVNLDKPWNYLWSCYEKTPPLLPRHTSVIRRPWGENTYGIVIINPPELPINEGAWNNAHIASTG